MLRTLLARAIRESLWKGKKKKGLFTLRARKQHSQQLAVRVPEAEPLQHSQQLRAARVSTLTLSHRRG